MTLPIDNSSDPSKVESTESGDDPSVAAIYNPYLAGLFVSNVSASTATGDSSAVESGVPALPTPASSDDVYRQLQLSMGEMVTDMLDAWLENIDENAKRSAEERKVDDESAAEKQADDLARSRVEDASVRKRGPISLADARGDIWRAGLGSILSLYIDEAPKVAATTAAAMTATEAPDKIADVRQNQFSANDLSGHHPSSAMTSALIIASGFVGSFEAGQAPGSVQLNNKVLQDAWSQIAIAHNPNDPATQVTGWVSALWGIGLAYFTAAKQVGKMEPEKEEPTTNLEFATKYAENLIAGLSSGQFAAHIKAIVVSNTKPGEQADPQHEERLSRFAKTILLTTALAQIMKLELGASYKENVYEGHISGDDVEAMLTGKIDFQTNDPHGLAAIKAKLIMQINNVMEELPPAEKAALMANMKIYFNTNPAVEKLSDVNGVIRSVFSPRDVDKRYLGENRM